MENLGEDYFIVLKLWSCRLTQFGFGGPPVPELDGRPGDGDSG
ncbi:MAG: hypothetical protein AB8V23_02315 [Candidatus Midichloria sp.]